MHTPILPAAHSKTSNDALVHWCTMGEIFSAQPFAVSQKFTTFAVD